jgi:hypothetical protein
MLALATLVAALAAAQPPAAYVDTGTARVPLAVTSWCWAARCGAPLGLSPRRVSVVRGAVVRVELAVAATGATVSVGGVHEKATVRGRELTFAATRGGGVSALVRFRQGWVIYTARLALR